ncbi:MAG: CNT family concentrative nucleoside transporter [Cryomorphaceae bacterium]
MIAIIGIIVLLAVAIFFSENRPAIHRGGAVKTLLLQIIIAVFALVTPIGTTVLNVMKQGVEKGIDYGRVGIEYVFGTLALAENGFILAFQVFPIIIFIAALFSVLFHLRIMDVVIKVIGGAISWITGASRLESTTAAANIFIGMTEAPLVILPYLKKISRSQMFIVMAVGLSSVAGTVLVAFAALGMRIDLLLTAAFMAAPGGLLMGRILVPETDTPFDIADTSDAKEELDQGRAGSIVEAAAGGAIIGMQVFLSVLAVILAFVALIALMNGIMGGVGALFGFPQLTVELILGYLFAPISFLMGVPWEEAQRAGALLGQKIILNEFVAYANFSPIMNTFSEHGQIVITIALCGFANFSALGILVAGLSTVVPERKSEISKLGIKAVLAGTLANFMSASIVGVIYAMMGLF